MAAVTAADKAQAFIEGRYAKSSSGNRMGGPGGGRTGGPGGNPPDGGNGGPGGTPPDGMNGGPGGEMPFDRMDSSERGFDNTDVAANSSGDEMDVGTPEAGTTQSAGSSANSNNYSGYAEMLAAYEADVAEIVAGDAYGKNIVDLYNPLNYIGARETANPTWMRIVCGAKEGDIAMFNSLNMQIAALHAGIDATIEWQWDGGHVPGEILGNSLPLWVDRMYGEYVSGVETVKPAAETQTTNGTAESATGTDLSGWVTIDEEGRVSFTLADGMAYRTQGASKAVPGFDVIDYGQEDYVFGNSDTNARHWSVWVLKVLRENQETLESLFYK